MTGIVNALRHRTDEDESIESFEWECKLQNMLSFARHHQPYRGGSRKTSASGPARVGPTTVI